MMMLMMVVVVLKENIKACFKTIPPLPCNTFLWLITYFSVIIISLGSKMFVLLLKIHLPISTIGIAPPNVTKSGNDSFRTNSNKKDFLCALTCT